jgi:NADP-dependent 3-hydroxy acid dehydrogenase YdfG
VVLCARNEAELEETADELSKSAPERKVLARACDVSDEKQVNDLVAFALRELGSFTRSWPTPAFTGQWVRPKLWTSKAWRRGLEINLFGVLLPCRALIPHFKQAGYGKIVVLSGGGATNPLPNISCYAGLESRRGALDGNARRRTALLARGREMRWRPAR